MSAEEQATAAMHVTPVEDHSFASPSCRDRLRNRIVVVISANTFHWYTAKETETASLWERASFNRLTRSSRIESHFCRQAFDSSSSRKLLSPSSSSSSSLSPLCTIVTFGEILFRFWPHSGSTGNPMAEARQIFAARRHLSARSVGEENTVRVLAG